MNANQDMTLCSILEIAATHPHGFRFLDRRENETFVSYEQLLSRAAATAGAFVEMGIRPGDKIALVLPTAPAFFEAFWGALFAGAVPVPLYPPVRLGRMDEYHEKTAGMLNAADVRLVCTDRRVVRILGRSVAKADLDLGCVSMGDLQPKPTDPVPISADAPALIQFSSGTTQAPKPVLLTHRQILANVYAIRTAILDAYPETDRKFHSGACWLPLYHDMGLIGCVMLAVAHPADLTLIPPEIFIARPAIWLRAISKYKATISPAPNFAFSLCADRIKDKDLEGVDLSSWRCALNGAEPVTPFALERFIERFVPFGLREQALTPVYGLAEAALAVTFSDLKKKFSLCRFNPDKLLAGQAEPTPGGKSLVSLGAPLPEYEIRILDEAGAPCPENAVGTVHVKGPSVMQGYHGNPDLTSKTIVDGWLDTGDTGFMRQGELYLYGRAKDLIIIRGKNYAPQMIEQALDDLEGVRKGCSAAVGHVPDDKDSEVLFVFIERDKKGFLVGDETLSDLAGRKITEATGLVPDTVIVLEPGTLARTSSGKIRRRESLKQYLTQTLAPPKQVSIFRMTAEMVRSKIAMTRLGQKEDS